YGAFAGIDLLQQLAGVASNAGKLRGELADILRANRGEQRVHARGDAGDVLDRRTELRDEIIQGGSDHQANAVAVVEPRLLRLAAGDLDGGLAHQRQRAEARDGVAPHLAMETLEDLQPELQ